MIWGNKKKSRCKAHGAVSPAGQQPKWCCWLLAAGCHGGPVARPRVYCWDAALNIIACPSPSSPRPCSVVALLFLSAMSSSTPNIKRVVGTVNDVRERESWCFGCRRRRGPRPPSTAANVSSSMFLC